MENVELDRITFLLNDENYKSELVTFRRSYQRLKVRLRNNHLNAQLKQVKTLINRLEIGFPVKFFEQHRQIKPNNKALISFRSHLCKFIHQIDQLITRAVAVYGSSQPHFQVGHLVQHYLVIRASLARLIFCFKGLLVYSIDLYLSLYKPKVIEFANKRKKIKTRLLSDQETREILLKHNCKPKEKVLTISDSPDIVEESTKPKKKSKVEEKIGQLIDRNTLRPVRACRKREIVLDD